MAWLHILYVAICMALFVLRLYIVLPIFSRGKLPTSARRKGKSARLPTDKKLCIILGSGGHTAEMARLLQGVDFDRYSQRLYIVGESDLLSLNQIGTLEAKRDHMVEEYMVSRIPRSREVGQSWSSSVFSSLSCLFSVCQTLFHHKPDIILCNGPGNCVIVCAVALIPKFIGLKHIPIIYVESFARVQSLSLSGKLLYFMADRFVVQWPGLLRKYPTAEFIPHLV